MSALPGHSTHKIEGMWPLQSKISHWLKRLRPSKFTSNLVKAEGPKEIIMDEKSTWNPTRQTKDNVS